MPNPTIPNFPPQGIQAQLDLLYLYNPDVANKMLEELQAGLIELEQLQEQVEKALQDMQGVLRYKGSVETEADLPTEGNVIGDVWNITSTDENVSWDGTQWDKFGSAIDTSNLVTQEEFEAVKNVVPANASTGNMLVTEEDLFKHSDLPSQTGNEGKFLSTNGETPVWEDIPAGPTNALLDLSNSGTTDYNLWTNGSVGNAKQKNQTVYGNGARSNSGPSAVFGSQAKASNGIAIGSGAQTTQGVAIGNNVKANVGSVIIGNNVYNATFPTLTSTVLLGPYYPDSDTSEPIKYRGFYWSTDILDDETQKVLVWKMLDGATGLIPVERVAVGGTAGQVLSKTATGMEWIDAPAGGGSGLPDQTNHTGFLQTNGKDASWSDKAALINNTSARNTTAINTGAAITASSSVVIGGSYDFPGKSGLIQIGQYNSSANSYSIGIGFSPTSSGYQSIALGYSATASGSEAIQLGNGTNDNAKTFQVFDHQVIDQNGHIPFERMNQVVKHLDTMPTAYRILNDVVMYTGATDETYTNGSFYQWQQTGTQTPEFSGSSSEITITDAATFYAFVETECGELLEVNDAISIDYNKMDFGGTVEETLNLSIRRGAAEVGSAYIRSLTGSGLSITGDFAMAEFTVTQTNSTYGWTEISTGGGGGVTEVFHDETLTGKGTEEEPLSVVQPQIILRRW